MKRLIITCQIVIVALFIVKISFLTEAIEKASLFSSFSLDHLGQAIAQTPIKGSKPSIRDAADDGLRNERDLLALLQKKQEELNTRESAVKAEEQKVLALKNEIMQKIEALKSLEAQLSTKLEADKESDAKRFKDLAKLYETIPPQKAAAMLEKLDLRTSAGISIRMKRDRAGAIWGYLSPQKATDITKEITRSVPPGTE